ncbi:nuclear transport factor 2 family protein [Thermodesulfobacteriota bacterium]
MDLKELEKKVKELEAKVSLADDIEQIKRLQKIYGYYLDNGLHQEIVDLFSDDTESVEVANRGVFLGKEGAKRFFLHAQGKPSPSYSMGRHIQMQSVVTVDQGGKTAKGRWQCLFMSVSNNAVPGVPRAVWGYGVYENEYIKEDGKWMFRKLHLNRFFYTPYEDGWLKTPDIGGPLVEPVAPDLPPTAYHPYPSKYVVPFHYKHPITGK